ncbi:MAG: sigma-54 dependent transcriptional regulator [Phycisphaerae bacterium]|nr:sigma-54 dependent transcriptional regulator [Phycisphaerae bacterium]MDW8261864.1 sigma-54 dependent transcriptional regulator [Phycisphaerales bacterium]
MPEISTNPARILIVEDETEHAQVMSEALERVGHSCEMAFSLNEAQARLRDGRFDVIVTDLLMDGRKDGLEVLRLARGLNPPPPVILVTAVNDVPTSKQAIQEGAYDYITKPLDLADFRAQVNRAVEKAELQRQNQILQEQIADRSGFEGIIGRSPGMMRVVNAARQVASSDIPVLLLGESGTGKDLIAQAIHNTSRRRKHRLVAVNCPAFTESLLEDELFGHVKGAFTGALTDREGRFEYASRGTLFLDEIGDMPPAMQAKLLRVLETGEVIRVGSNEPRKVDVRLISATNKNLEELVAEKVFREDLFFRIKGMTIRIPPLRERREDIPLLTHFFLRQSAEKHGKSIEGITPEAQRALTGYSWPGNVRQLRSTIDLMVVMSNGPMLTLDDVPPELRGVTTADAASARGLAGVPLDQLEKQAIAQTLEMCNGNREQAARMLGMGERTLYRKIKEYGL